MSRMILDIRSLEDRFVRLEPFAGALKSEVGAALDCDPDAWEIMVSPAHGVHFDAWWDAAFESMRQGHRISYAVREMASGRVVGTTSLYEIKPDYCRCEIGSTFYRPEARDSPINPACKRLLLGHAFASGAVRVEILTDAINPASQAAIRKLGARDEGILRKHKITWRGASATRPSSPSLTTTGRASG